MQKSNVEELKEILNFGFAVQEAVASSIADDDQITKGDLPHLFPVIPAALAAIEDAGNPWERYKALSDEEKAELREYALERFDLPDEELEALIRETIVEISGDLRVARKWAAYRKN